MSDVFISYSRDDQAVARLYAEGLQRAGLSVWWDVALNPGETFDKVTEQALREARAVLVLWSKRSVDSRWVRSEATQADRYGTLIPVTIEPCERPILFELAHTIDMNGWSGDVHEARWQTLLGSVQRMVNRGPGAHSSGAGAGNSAAASVASPPVRRSSAYSVGWIVASAVAVAAAAALAWKWHDRPAGSGQLMRFTVRFADDVHYTIGEDFMRSASIAPDGRKVVFTGSDEATGVARLFIRQIDSERATALEGTEDGTEPFWSPDSKFVGFYAGGKLKIANLEGGPVREIADATATGGASWNAHGQILVSLSNPGPLMLVPAAGGAPKVATTMVPGDIDHDWPQFLEDGVHFLYVVRGLTFATNKVYLASLDSPERTLLLDGVLAFTYASPSRVMYLNKGALVVQMLDVKARALVGAPVILSDSAQPPLSASRSGALTYRTLPTRPAPLLWIKPDGTVIGDAVPPGYYTDPQVSPDGSRLAFAARDTPDGPWHIAIADIASGALRRLGVGAASQRAPVWSPDGKSVVFLSLQPDAPGLYRMNANGVGTARLVLPSKGVVWPYQWTRVAGLSFFDGISGSNDMGILAGADLTRRTMIVETPANDVDGAVSPDGKWVIYTSNATGRWELYLTTVAKSDTRVQITTQGACDPVWNPNGTRLYYTRPATAELMAMPVTQGVPPTFGTPERIHPGPLEYASAHSIDFDPSGKRIVIAPSEAVRGDLTVLVNWQAALGK
jgi:Tol biopolymer transport system component